MQMTSILELLPNATCPWTKGVPAWSSWRALSWQWGNFHVMDLVGVAHKEWVVFKSDVTEIRLTVYILYLEEQVVKALSVTWSGANWMAGQKHLIAHKRILDNIDVLFVHHYKHQLIIIDIATLPVRLPFCVWLIQCSSLNCVFSVVIACPSRFLRCCFCILKKIPKVYWPFLSSVLMITGNILFPWASEQTRWLQILECGVCEWQAYATGNWPGL